MTTADINALRFRCTEAFSAYGAHLKTVLAQCTSGEVPTPQELRAEELALYEYARLRRELLDALALAVPGRR